MRDGCQTPSIDSRPLVVIRDVRGQRKCRILIKPMLCEHYFEPHWRRAVGGLHTGARWLLLRHRGQCYQKGLFQVESPIRGMSAICWLFAAAAGDVASVMGKALLGQQGSLFFSEGLGFTPPVNASPSCMWSSQTSSRRDSQHTPNKEMLRSASSDSSIPSMRFIRWPGSAPGPGAVSARLWALSPLSTWPTALRTEPTFWHQEAQTYLLQRCFWIRKNLCISLYIKII